MPKKLNKAKWRSYMNTHFRDSNIELNNRIGISTNIFDNPLELHPLIEDLSQNFRVIEIEFENTLKKISTLNKNELESFIDKILEIKKQKKLYISIHAPYIGKSADIAADDETIRLQAVSNMKAYLDISKRFGAELFTFHPGYLDRTGINREKLISNLEKSLTELSPYANQLGITLALENTGNERPNYIVLSLEEHVDLYHKFGVFMTMDIIHYSSFNPISTHYYEYLKSFIPYIKNIHIADMKIPSHIHLPFGEGTLPYDEIIQFLYRNGYKGNFIVEEKGARYPDQIYKERAINYKNKLLEIT